MKKFTAIQIILGYALVFVGTLLALQEIWFTGILDEVNFIVWDASNYNFIKENGYAGDKVAFFPLFPLLWKFLSIGPYGIVLINVSLFFIGFYLLIKILYIKAPKEILLFLSIPSFIFFFLPYSEAIFFLCSAIILIGLKKHKNYFIYLGLFFATLSRPAFTIFIPALIITEFLAAEKHKSVNRIINYLLVSCAGILIVVFIQYIDTGTWFEFFSAQKNWGNTPQIPKLPLTSWADGFVTRTDAFTFLIGILSGSFLIGLMLKQKWFGSLKPPKEVIFSLAYIGGITLSVLIFRGGSLFSLNRFVLATPFIIVVLHYWITSELFFTRKDLLIISFLVFCFWLLFGSYIHILLILKFAFLTIYALLLFSLKSEKAFVRKYSLIFLIMLNFTFQVIFYLRFLEGKWVG